MSLIPCHARDFPDAGEGLCCIGSAVNGPERCTCWRPVYDLEQAELAPAKPEVRSAPCGDCAYRGGSPERAGDPEYLADQAQLDELVATGEPFFCHQGIRRPLRWEHHPDEGPPTGASVPGRPAEYTPPIVAGVPYKADGSPADLCAGWASRVPAGVAMAGRAGAWL